MPTSLKPTILAGLVLALLGAGTSQASTFVFRQSAPGLAPAPASPLTLPPAQPSANLTPSALSFADTVVGSSSATQFLTLTNTGSLALAVQSPTTSGDFSVSSACPASLDIGQTCNLTLTFSPTAAGARNGTLSLGTGAGTQSASLTGNGVISGLTILSAIYGSVSQPKDMTAQLQTACNSLQSCTYNPRTIYGSDPYPSKTKDVSITYTCSTGGTPRTLTDAAGVGDNAVHTMTCP